MAAALSSSVSVKSDEKHSDPEMAASVADEKYEGSSDAHSQDPLAQFSEDEIKRTWRKVDLHILPVAVLLYLSSYIDRYANPVALAINTLTSRGTART